MSWKTLVADPDGTLLLSDLLHESFLSTLAHDWRTPSLFLMALHKGRAPLKRHPANAHALEISTIPCCSQVIGLI